LYLSLTHSLTLSLSLSGFILQERIVELTIIGLRNLAPYLYIPISDPYIVVELCGKSYKTRRSHKPSGHSPNFLECATFKLQLPTDPKFVEPLQLTVYDDRVMTFPIIATCSIDLGAFYDSATRKTNAFVAK
jgi:Ca2+-dependent lipid-binding protein